MNRPPHVPPEAVRVESLIQGKITAYWWLGEKRDGKFVGESRYWRESGALWCLEHYNAAGQPHGVWESYHPNGDVAEHKPYHDGKANGIWWGQRSSDSSAENWRLVMSSILVAHERNPVWRNEITYQASAKHGTYRFFLADGRACNGLGVPVGTVTPALAPVLERFDFACASLEPKGQVALANECMDELRRMATEVRWYFDEARVRTTGPASEATIAEVERQCGTLPPSYRRFLSEDGQLCFEGSPNLNTARPESIPECTNSFRSLIDHLEDDLDEVDETTEGGGPPVSDWQELQVGGQGGMLPREQRRGRFLGVGDDHSDGCVMGIDLAQPGDEPPFFWLWHDEPCFYLFARGTKEWIKNLLRHWLAEQVGEVERLYQGHTG